MGAPTYPAGAGAQAEWRRQGPGGMRNRGLEGIFLPPTVPNHYTIQTSMEIGLYTFAEATPDPVTGRTVTPAGRLRDLVEEVELTDQVGLDVYGVGEHHRPDYVASAPAVILAAAAARTKRIRLTSAATVLSSHAPLRV